MGIINRPLATAPKPSADSRLKMHLRLLHVDGYTYRVVTLRPGTGICFSTNFFHQTWHIVTSQRGAHLLARLLWGLSYQRLPGTLLLVHGDHLLPTPFEAERSDPFLIVPAGLTRLDPTALRTLKGRLKRLGPPASTVRWQTFGLDAALQARQSGADAPSPTEIENEQLRWKKERPRWHQEGMERRGGFIVYWAPPPILRKQALRIHDLRVRKGDCEMDYHFLAEFPCRPFGDGEVQIFADYVDRVAAAVQARQELVAHPNQPILSETVQEVVSRRDQIKARQAARGSARTDYQV